MFSNFARFLEVFFNDSHPALYSCQLCLQTYFINIFGQLIIPARFVVSHQSTDYVRVATIIEEIGIKPAPVQNSKH